MSYFGDAQFCIESDLNSTTTPLSGAATFTGTGELNPYPSFFIDCRTDADCTVFVDFSVDNINWTSFPVNGYELNSGNGRVLVDTAEKAGRYFRVRIVNGAAAQTYLRCYVYFGVFRQLNSPLNQSVGLYSGAINTRPVIAQDEITRELRGGAEQWNKFGFRDNLQAANGEETIWAAASGVDLTIMTTPETFDIAYNNVTDGAAGGATGAQQLTFYYLDANERFAIAQHTLGSTGTDTTSFTGLGINRCVVTISGTSNANVNDITITNTTSGNVQAILPAGGSVTQQAFFFMPNQAYGAAKWLLLNANKLSGSNPRVLFKGYVYSRTTSTTYEVFRHTMDTQSENTLSIKDPCNFRFSPRDVFYMVADTDQNNTVVACRFSLNVYDQV